MMQKFNIKFNYVDYIILILITLQNLITIIYQAKSINIIIIIPRIWINEAIQISFAI